MAEQAQTRYPEPDQIEQLHQEIAKKGFAVDDFEWGKTDSKKTPDLKVFAVLHRSTLSSFVFDFDGNRRLTIRKPGLKSSRETLFPRNWTERVRNFRAWLKLVKHETQRREAAEIATHEKEIEREREAFLSYEGDTYLSDLFADEHTSTEEARELVQQPNVLCFWLAPQDEKTQGLELAKILKDKYATQALCEAIVQRDEKVLRALSHYTKRMRPKGKPGPKPKKGSKEHIQDQVAKLKLRGLTHGQIALKLWGDSNKASLARAHYSHWREKISRKEQP